METTAKKVNYYGKMFGTNLLLQPAAAFSLACPERLGANAFGMDDTEAPNFPLDCMMI